MPVLPEFEDPMARPRYTGLATFMRAPYREDWAGVEIGLIGVPFDGGVTNRTGTRHGPREIRNQSSLMRKINQASGIAPYELCQVADLGDAWVQRPFHLESSLEEIRDFYRRIEADALLHRHAEMIERMAKLYAAARNPGVSGLRCENHVGGEFLGRLADAHAAGGDAAGLNRRLGPGTALEQAALDAESQFKAAQAELTTLRATLQRELLNQESITAQVHSEYQQARMEAETNDNLRKNGLIAELEYKTSIIKRDELENRDKIEQKRLEFARDSIDPQLAAKQATVDHLEASAKLKARDVEALHVKAGMAGVLQQLPVEVGQRVIAGTNLARVADPAKLKAQIKIAETQAKDIQINQPASIDTRNGIVAGHVIRVDPAVEQGTVTVDVALDESLPKGARPDLSVDGTIELERLDNVLYVERPAFAQDGATVGVFKFTSSGEAVRTPVHFGRSSVNTIEILSGLNVGDQVILSDTSAYDSHDRIQVN